MVIDYGDVVTAGGVLAWTDLGLRLIERFLGPTVMLETARYMNVDPSKREQRFYSDFDPRTKHGDQAMREMLEFSRTSVDQIAASIGYNDVGGFRRVFRKITGLTPSDYRKRFCRPTTQLG